MMSISHCSIGDHCLLPCMMPGAALTQHPCTVQGILCLYTREAEGKQAEQREHRQMGRLPLPS